MKFRNAFQAKLLKRSGPNRVFVYFDSDDDRKTEYTGKIFKTSRLVMATSGQGSHFERLPVTKPNATTLKVTVPAGAPFNPNGPMRIAAKSFYSGTVCPTKCTDRVLAGLGARLAPRIGSRGVDQIDDLLREPHIAGGGVVVDVLDLGGAHDHARHRVLRGTRPGPAATARPASSATGRSRGDGVEVSGGRYGLHEAPRPPTRRPLSSGSVGRRRVLAGEHAHGQRRPHHVADAEVAAHRHHPPLDAPVQGAVLRLVAPGGTHPSARHSVAAWAIWSAVHSEPPSRGPCHGGRGRP